MEDIAEWLLAQISGDHPAQRSADYTRQELTRRFAANPGRHGALTASRLYREILPQLMERSQCRIRSKVGKRTTYTFQWDCLPGRPMDWPADSPLRRYTPR